MDHVKGARGKQLSHPPLHGTDFFADDGHGSTSSQSNGASPNIAQPRALDWEGLNRFKKPFQVSNILRPVVWANKGEQGDLVLARQVSQNVVGADLGAGNQGIRQ
jgi:hypothetical protein